MLTLFWKYTGNKKFGLYGNYKDWTVAGKAKDEMQAVEKIQQATKLFKNFEFKYE